MKRILLILIAVLLLAGSWSVLFAEDKIPGDILVRGSVGFDPIGGGFGFGGGAGYRFSVGSAYNEVLADFFYSTSKETSTEGNWEYDYQDWLYIFGVRWDWLFLYTPYENGFYALAGVGFWFGGFEWKETSTWIPDGSAGPTGGEEGSSGGSIFNVGAAWVFAKRWEVRLELPILISFGSYYRSTGVAIPITASIMYAF
ncbi:MAG: hypothetical protein KAS61_04485 [Spirochaetes bacterium]|nr:hypothetical protein [Spirochaetota bacterium]